MISTTARSFGKRSHKGRTVHDGFSGGSLRIKESYVREDVQLPSVVLEAESKDVIIIPTASTLDNYFDAILACGNLTKRIVVLGSVLNRLRVQGLVRTLHKLRAKVTRDVERQWITFADEHCKQVSIPRNLSEAVKCLASWATSRLVVISENVEFREALRRTCPSSLQVVSMMEFLHNFGAERNLISREEYETALRLAESVESRLTVSPSLKEHGSSKVETTGPIIRGKLKCVSSRVAFVNDYMIISLEHRNKAIHGDTVEIASIRNNDNLDGNLSVKDVDESSMKELKTIKATYAVVSIIKRAPYRNLVVTLDEREYETYRQTGNDESSSRYILCVPMDERFPKVRIFSRHGSSLVGKRFVVSITGWPDHSTWPEGTYVKTLGSCFDISVESSAILVETGLEDHEAPFAQSIIRSLPVKDDFFVKVGSLGAEDFRDRQVMSIDPIGCQDIDDAISLKSNSNGTYELTVHIADVCRFIESCSELDLEAYSRATSIYLQERRLDMLPSILCEDLCSLRPKLDRYAFSCVFQVNSNLTVDVDSARFTRTVIRSRYALAYEQAQNLVEGRDPLVYQSPHGRGWTGGPVDEADFGWMRNTIDTLMKISRIRERERNEQGAVHLDAEGEYKFALNSELKPVKVASHGHLEIHDTIAELMILANEAAAKVSYKKAPLRALLRYHPPADPKRFGPCVELARQFGLDFDASSNKNVSASLNRIRQDQKIDRASVKLLEQMATRSMTEAQYICSGISRQELGGKSPFYHFGLGLDFYTHFTSPIRRYADVLVARILLETQTESETYNELALKNSKQIQHADTKATNEASSLKEEEPTFKENQEHFPSIETVTAAAKSNAKRLVANKIVSTKLQPDDEDDDEGNIWANAIDHATSDETSNQLFSWDAQHNVVGNSAAPWELSFAKNDTIESTVDKGALASTGLNSLLAVKKSSRDAEEHDDETFWSSAIATTKDDSSTVSKVQPVNQSKPPVKFDEYCDLFTYVLPPHALPKCEVLAPAETELDGSVLGNNKRHAHTSTMGVQDACDHINTRHRSAKDASHRSQQLFFSLYFSDQPQNTKALLMSIIGDGLICFIPEYDLRIKVLLKDRDGVIRTGSFCKDNFMEVKEVVSVENESLRIHYVDQSSKTQRQDKVLILKKMELFTVRLVCRLTRDIEDDEVEDSDGTLMKAPLPRLSDVTGQIVLTDDESVNNKGKNDNKKQEMKFMLMEKYKVKQKAPVRTKLDDQGRKWSKSLYQKCFPHQRFVKSIQNQEDEDDQDVLMMKVMRNNIKVVPRSHIMKRVTFGGFVSRKPLENMRQRIDDEEEEEDYNPQAISTNINKTKSSSSMSNQEMKKMEKAAMARVAKLQAEKFDSRVKRRMKKGE